MIRLLARLVANAIIMFNFLYSYCVGIIIIYFFLSENQKYLR